MKEKIQARLLKGAKALRKHEELTKRSDAALAEAKSAFGLTGIGTCYGLTGNGECSIEIPLATYLTLFPDARPERKQYQSGERHREWFSYPDQYIGATDGIKLWVSARTASVDVEPVSQASKGE